MINWFDVDKYLNNRHSFTSYKVIWEKCNIYQISYLKYLNNNKNLYLLKLNNINNNNL